MNSSPFELFRRNLKPLMVLLVGLAMFAFIVLPVLDQYLRKSAGGTDGDIVASFNGRDLTRGRVSYFTQNHQSTVRFLVELAQETINRGGSPQTAGFQYDMQSQQVRAIGINEVPSQMGSIRSLMLAFERRTMGSIWTIMPFRFGFPNTPTEKSPTVTSTPCCFVLRRTAWDGLIYTSSYEPIY